MNKTIITENEALIETVDALIKFEKQFGREATELAIANGAFHEHKYYGDVSYIFKHRDFNEDHITIPQWISDIFITFVN